MPGSHIPCPPWFKNYLNNSVARLRNSLYAWISNPLATSIKNYLNNCLAYYCTPTEFIYMRAPRPCISQFLVCKNYLNNCVARVRYSLKCLDSTSPAHLGLKII